MGRTIQQNAVTLSQQNRKTTKQSTHARTSIYRNDEERERETGKIIETFVRTESNIYVSFSVCAVGLKLCFFLHSLILFAPLCLFSCMIFCRFCLIELENKICKTIIKKLWYRWCWRFETKLVRSIRSLATQPLYT